MFLRLTVSFLLPLCLSLSLSCNGEAAGIARSHMLQALRGIITSSQSIAAHDGVAADSVAAALGAAVKMMFADAFTAVQIPGRGAAHASWPP